MQEPSFHTRDSQRGKSLADYWPLAVLVLIAAAMATAIAYPAYGLMGWMHGYMGVFLCIFAMLKLFTPGTFVKGFHMYDLLGMRVRAYGYVYPYLELGLGLAYLAGITAPLLYAFTMVLFGFGALGVMGALRRGLDIYCPCMGSVLQVPLSTVTLLEDLGMVGMAAVMLWLHA